MKLLKNVISVMSAAAIASSMLISVNAEVTDENLTAVNGATNDTIAAAVSEYAAAAGKDSLYSVLPDCDKTEINTRILAGIPFSNTDELAAAYDDAVSKTVKTDTDLYSEYLYEGFASGSFDTNGWTATNNPQIREDKEIHDGTTAHALPVDEGDTYCVYTAGGMISSAAYRGYISKIFDESINGVVTVYFYDANGTSTNSTYLVQVGDSNDSNHCYIGVQGNSTKYVYRTKTNGTDGSLAASNISRTIGWHKIEFDATSGSNVKGYIDGQLIVTFTDMTSIGKLQIGNWRTDANDYSYFSTDNISISVSKTAEDYLKEFNAAPSVQTLENVLPYTEADTALYAKLPECDRTEIAEAVGENISYESVSALQAAYDTALINTAQADSSEYKSIFTEDFADGIDSSWTVSQTAPTDLTEGAAFKGNAVDTLNISGSETKAIGFMGNSLSGGNISIKRAVNPNSRITAYFYDFKNDGTYSLGFKINDNVFVAAYATNTQYMISTNNGADGGWKSTGVPVSKGWHKVVFDGTANSGKVDIYVDGVKTTLETEIEYIQIGNLWSHGSYALYAVDNITIAEANDPEPELTPSVTTEKLDTVDTSIEGVTSGAADVWYCTLETNGVTVKGISVKVNGQEQEKELTISDEGEAIFGIVIGYYDGNNLGYTPEITVIE